MFNKLGLALTLAALVPAIAVAQDAKKIQDNSFLLEEAYNQEAGVVQHIQSAVYNRRSRNWAYTFTQEWPAPDETHQLSYTLPVNRLADASGIGDLTLNYRYQAILQERIAFAPRFSVILPTGAYRKGLGTGAPGYQINLPLSVELSDRIVSHFNLGATHTPDSREPGGAKADTTARNYGASLVFLATANLNLLLEAVRTAGDVVQVDGSRLRERTTLVNPGIRYASNFSSGMQVVSGVSFPRGVGSTPRERSVLLYLSVEHPFK